MSAMRESKAMAIVFGLETAAIGVGTTLGALVGSGWEVKDWQEMHHAKQEVVATAQTWHAAEDKQHRELGEFTKHIGETCVKYLQARDDAPAYNTNSIVSSTGDATVPKTNGYSAVDKAWQELGPHPRYKGQCGNVMEGAAVAERRDDILFQSEVVESHLDNARFKLQETTAEFHNLSEVKNGAIIGGVFVMLSLLRGFNERVEAVRE